MLLTLVVVMVVVVMVVVVAMLIGGIICTSISTNEDESLTLMIIHLHYRTS